MTLKADPNDPLNVTGNELLKDVAKVKAGHITNTEGEHTGKSVSYYSVSINQPTNPVRGTYITECNDIIEALNMTYAEANVFKAIWRIAAARTLGKLKKGNSALYDAEKAVFFAERVLIQEGDKMKEK
jgi:hypothetical protein